MTASMSENELIAKSDHLQEEASHLLEEGGLFACFADADAAEVVGSVTTGLMTKRDIDVTCRFEPLDSGRLLAIGAKIAQAFPVPRMTYVDPSVMPWHDYTVGLYLNVAIRTNAVALWNIDIWAYGREDFQTAMKGHRELALKLRTIDRSLTLRLKSGSDAQSYYVYEAILEHGVRTKEELERYLTTAVK